MSLFSEARLAFRARRLIEWLFTDRPQIPILFGATFYSFFYLTYKYDILTRWKGQPIYNV
jgi:hypothetical protein